MYFGEVFHGEKWPSRCEQTLLSRMCASSSTMVLTTTREMPIGAPGELTRLTPVRIASTEKSRKRG